ncbi:LuxR family transcriptional regulator [Burkholderia ubonensis]|uniref:LuxR C-terminal-related transcriptional regulator n=1 Tax=Burkholderia ubonensis TaxID=101571 RepID=UPI00075DA66A|nr:LuxR C-terminal-related transcriptional regulator [Burkholderia ubonensis]KVN64451.1 LuxR family transcriptional regulator [Burkholderia ubonensis]KWI10588.1 LuxR family transcriptional regulator [Burkholderia ubonensis]KWI34529.1 LuxR family transcriptional regulator [Burkholderia ubonensis]ODQ40255.1 LuxR family transcriptional regulator [Burkholderia ubonensis]OJA24677.1 LuxR family transcriptional regulator [Burkholderia ubonensis]
MAHPPDRADPAPTELVLKTTAPRVPAQLLARARLSLAAPGFDERPITLVQAPAGYGKTSLLAQWRRECLALGRAVIWLSADERDDAPRLLQGLVQAVRTGCARPGFGRLIARGAPDAARALEGMTAWLAEVAQLSIDALLIVDDAERLPAAGLDALTYVLHNAPPNLRVVVAARRGLDHAAADLLAGGQCLLVGPDWLRFTLDETIALVGARFAQRVDADACARLFERVDGWPLGLQLAMAAMARAADPRQAVDALAARAGGTRDRLVELLLANLSADDTAFLTQVSVVDRLHPSLCGALLDDAGASARLARLARDTPLFIASDDSDWCRLHPLVRDALRDRLAAGPDAARGVLHARAAGWLDAHGMTDEAARHAYAAGQLELAYALAQRCLENAIKEGRIDDVLDWLARLPDAELDKRPALRIAVAWALALGERHVEARRQIAGILAAPDTPPAMRYECALILSAAAYYADEIDRFVELFEPWADFAPPPATWLAQMHANRLSARAIILGEPAQARRFQQAAPRSETAAGFGYVARWGELITGFSYLCEGQRQLADDVLSPALARAEADLGRRHPLTCMFAALCAALAYEADRVDQAAALLANRLDVLEHAGIPDTVLLGYCTAARIALLRGLEHRAIDLLEALDAMGVARRLPRLSVASLAEQVRIHAARYREATCHALVERIDAIAAAEFPAHGPLWRRPVVLLQASAHAGAALAARRWEDACAALDEAAALAREMNVGRARIEIMALGAFALEQSGQDGRARLVEAMNLADVFGLTRTLADAHPAVADWARRVGDEAAASASPAGLARHALPQPRVVPPAPRSAAGPRAVPSVVLTPKERAILELLARNLSNKEIAVALAVGEETVKWHLKNLFGKLDASSRKHAVRRALVLGLLENAP